MIKKRLVSGQLSSLWRLPLDVVPSQARRDGSGAAHCCNIYASYGAMSSSTWTAMPFTAEFVDTDNFHDTSTNNTRFTVPTGMDGRYLFIGSGNMFAFNGNWRSGYRLRKNGSTTYGESYSRGAKLLNGAAAVISGILNLSAGDYVELQGWQDTGGSLQCSGQVQAVYLGPSIACAYAYTTTGNSANSSAHTAIQFDLEDVDTGAIHDTSTNNSRLVAPKTGKYLLVYFATAAGTSARFVVSPLVNGNTRLLNDNLIDSPDFGSTSVECGGYGWSIASLTAGDYVELTVFHDAGSNKTIKGGMSMVEIPYNMAFAAVYKSGSAQTPAAVTFTSITFESELYDDYGMHDNATNNQRFVPSVGGNWLTLGRTVAAPSSSSNHDTYIQFRKNAAGYQLANAAELDPSQDTRRDGFDMFQASNTDYLVMDVYNDPGVAMQVTGTTAAIFRCEDWFQ